MTVAYQLGLQGQRGNHRTTVAYQLYLSSGAKGNHLTTVAYQFYLSSRAKGESPHNGGIALPVFRGKGGIKDERGTSDRQGFRGWPVQPRPPDSGHKVGGHILLKPGTGPVRGQENGSGWERGSFLSVRVFFFFFDPIVIAVK